MVDTSPWTSVPADVPAAGNFGVTYSAVPYVYPAVTRIGGATLDLEIEYAARRSPYVTATATLGFPPNAQMPYYDPTRYDLRLAVNLGYRRVATGEVESYRVALLRVTDAVLDYTAQTVQLRASSDESIVNAQQALTARSFAVTDDVGDAVRTLISDAFPGETLVFDGNDSPRKFTAADVVRIGDDLYDAITDYADALRVEVRHDGLGVWRLDAPVNIPGAADATLRTGPRGDIMGLRIVRDRSQAITDAIIRWNYTAAGGATKYGYASATTGGTPRATVSAERKRRPADPGAAAYQLLARATRRGQSVQVEALPKFWLRPYDTIAVNIPAGVQIRALIERVKFIPHRATMTIEAQAPIRGAHERITVGAVTAEATP